MAKANRTANAKRDGSIKHWVRVFQVFISEKVETMILFLNFIIDNCKNSEVCCFYAPKC